jgi:hypothetical protein
VLVHQAVGDAPKGGVAQALHLTPSVLVSKGGEVCQAQHNRQTLCDGDNPIMFDWVNEVRGCAQQLTELMGKFNGLGMRCNRRGKHKRSPHK